MPYVIIDGGTVTRYMASEGAGSNPDPYYPLHRISSGTVDAVQSGAWTVAVSGTPPVAAQQSGAWNVGGTVNAIQSGAWAVTVSGTPPVAAQQSGAWNVGGTVDAIQSGAWAVTVSGTPPVAAQQSGAWNVGGTVELAAGNNSVGATKDDGPAWDTIYGLSGERFVSADQSASAANVCGTPASGEYLVVTDIITSVAAEMRVDFTEETSGTVLLTAYLPARSVWHYTPRGKLKLPTADKRLQVQTDAAGSISVLFVGYSEA